MEKDLKMNFLMGEMQKLKGQNSVKKFQIKNGIILFITETIQKANIQNYGTIFQAVDSGLKFQEILLHTKFLRQQN